MRLSQFNKNYAKIKKKKKQRKKYGENMEAKKWRKEKMSKIKPFKEKMKI